jgi:hypothetical protein
MEAAILPFEQASAETPATKASSASTTSPPATAAEAPWI